MSDPSIIRSEDCWQNDERRKLWLLVEESLTYLEAGLHDQGITLSASARYLGPGFILISE